MTNQLILQSRNDIPFIDAQLTVHQPTINEISLVGEEVFFKFCQLIKINKDSFSSQDKIGLEDKSNFEIFMSIVNHSSDTQFKEIVLKLLTLMFPQYQVTIGQNEIVLLCDTGMKRINAFNFDAFKDIVITIFDLNDVSGDGAYNPVDSRADKIAKKLQHRKEKIAQRDGVDSKDVSVFGRYVSILSVGLAKDKNTLMNYTVPQLKDEFRRYQKKLSFDAYVQAKIAGASDLEEVENWME